MSGRLRDQLALQAMVNIARAHDRQSEMVPSLENLASYQQVPLEALERMLEALRRDGLVARSTEDPPRFLPGASLQRIKLADILRSARRAEDNGQSETCRSDSEVSGFLQTLEQDLDTHLGQESLLDFLQRFEDKSRHESSLVQR
jgi:DNA-binding IscR family transcriptional regulator